MDTDGNRMFIPWWGIVGAGFIVVVLLIKVWHLLYRIRELGEMVRKMEGIEEELRDDLREYEEEETSERNKKSIFELDDIDERRDSGGG